MELNKINHKDNFLKYRVVKDRETYVIDCKPNYRLKIINGYKVIKKKGSEEYIPLKEEEKSKLENLINEEIFSSLCKFYKQH